MKQIKEPSACSAKKRWKMNSFKEAAEYGRAKVDKAHALLPGDASKLSRAVVSGCRAAARTPRRTDGWKDGRRSRHQMIRMCFSVWPPCYREPPTYGWSSGMGAFLADRPNPDGSACDQCYKRV